MPSQLISARMQNTGVAVLEGVAVGVLVDGGVPVGVIVMVGVTVLVGVGVARTVCASYAPLSHSAVPSPLPSKGRGSSRSSVGGGGQLLAGTLSIAALPPTSACVFAAPCGAELGPVTGPPLSAS